MTRSLRILKITGAYPPAYAHGGTVTAAHSLCMGLISLGHRVSVLTTDINGAERLAVPPGWTTWDLVPVRYCRWIRGPIPYFSWELVQELRQSLGEYDIVLLDSAWTGYGVLSGRECIRVKVPYVIYAHGCHGPRHLRKSRLRKRLWWLAFDRRLYERASAAVALTEAEVDDLRSMGVTTRIEHIPNGVDIDGLANGAGREEIERTFPRLRRRPYVLYLGRLEPIKGLDVLIPAFASITSRFRDLILVIAGPDDRGYEKTVRSLVRSYGLQDSVLLTGVVAGPTKIGLLRNADLFALPSYGEGMSVALLEAMACGIPVLISEHCRLPEVSETGAGVVVPASARGLATGLMAMLSDVGARRRMGVSGKRLVAEQFQWEAIAQQTAGLCSEVVARAAKAR